MKHETQLASDGGALVDSEELAKRVRGNYWLSGERLAQEAADCIEQQLRLLKRMRDLLGWQCPPGQEDELEAIDADLRELGISNKNRAQK
jgi:hypothetical protein